MSADFPFLGGSFNGRSPFFDAERTVNLYAEVSESGESRSPLALIGTPGLRRITTLAGGGVRGLFKFSETTLIAVVGTNVWKLDTGFNATLIGTVANEGPVVSMASNGSIIMMVSGAFGYFINPTTSSVTQITDSDFYGGDRVDYLDGYFVWNHPGTGQFQVSQLYGSDIDGLDFATAEGAPDPVVSLIVDHRELWLFGSQSTEVWYNAGGADFPLQRIQGAFMEVGCLAKHSVAKLDNSVFWLAANDRGYGMIMKASGYAPQRISNHALEFAIASYSTVSDAVAFTYWQEGHSFYVISFPTAGATWCFDVASGLWHERPYLKLNGNFDRHRANCQVNFAGMTIVGDWETGKLYELDLDTYTDDGANIYRARVCPYIASAGEYVFVNNIELFMQTGVGLSSGAAPQAMLSWSDDGGQVWSNEIWSSIGRIGQREQRVKWRRLGVSRHRLFKVAISDPIKVVFTGAAVDVERAAA